MIRSSLLVEIVELTYYFRIVLSCTNTISLKLINRLLFKQSAIKGDFPGNEQTIPSDRLSHITRIAYIPMNSKDDIIRNIDV